MATPAFEAVLIVSLVAKSQDPLSFRCEVSQKSRIEEERVVPIILNVLLLERDTGVVIIQEHRLSGLQYRRGLPVDSRGIKQDCRAGSSRNLHDPLSGNL